MKNILLALILFSFVGQAQDIKPISANFKYLYSPSFSYYTIDSTVWIYKGAIYGWTKLVSSKDLKDTLKYYVPYIGATKTVDLGSQLITSKKQLLPLFNGACAIPTIADNGDGSITVGDGEYHLSTRTDGKGTQSYVITGGTYTLTDNTTNYLVADYNSGTPIVHVITDVNLINETTVVPIYTAYRNGTTLHYQNWDALGVALANKVHQSIVKTQRYRREYGLGISEYPTRYLSVGNGRVWVGAVPVSVDAISTSTDNLRLFYHSGGTWTVSVQSQYNNTQYDNGTNLVTLTSNRYAVNWLFRGIESQKHLYVVLGTGDYTLAQAQEAVLPAIPIAISSHAMLIGKLIVQKSATTATSIQSAFEVQFSTATPNAHNDLTGRDVSDTHPSGSISFSPTGTITGTTVYQALTQLDSHDIASVGVSGTNTKQITLTKNSGGTLTTTFTDLDNQTLSNSASGSTRTITISGGNSTSFNVNGGNAASVANSITFNNSGSGDVSGSTYNGSAAKTVSYNTLGALPTSAISGTANYISKFTGTNTIGNSQIIDNGTNTSIGASNPAADSKLYIGYPTTYLSGFNYGIRNVMNATANSDGTTDARGMATQVVLTGTSSASALSGLSFDVYNQASSPATVNIVNAITGSVRTTGTSNSNGMYGYRIIPILSSSGNVTEYRGFEAKSPSCSSTGVIATAYGFFAAAHKVTGVTTAYGFYQQGASDFNYFAGVTLFNTSNNGVDRVQIGGTLLATTAKLTNLTDGKIPYHVSDATGLSDSPITVSGNNISITGSAKVGDDSTSASSANVGAIRYRVSGNNSYCEMVMQTGTSTYSWVVIKSNSW